MFWFYYGMGLICDVLIGADDSSSYAAVQLVLVGALGVTAYRGHPSVRGSDSDSFRTIATGSYSLLQQTQSPKDVNVSKSAYKSREPSLPTARGFSLQSTTAQPTQSSTSLLSSVTAQSFTEKAVESTLVTAVLADTETAMEIFPVYSPRHRSAAAWLVEHRKNK
ncbi:hypothetical protein COOONC_14899, partial [Cooperia oncophora]